jgi:phosphoribosylformimino-5-aminoimidazole carboxamide ribotide isomerase
VFQVGGGIRADNAMEWLQHGAGKIIVTSYLFPEGKFSIERLKNISDITGKDRLVVDLSCRKVVNGSNLEYVVAMNKWQTLTDIKITHESIKLFEEYSSELLVHAADVEGLCKGIDQDLVKLLGMWCKNPVTYAGGGNSINDLELVKEMSNGKVDLTFGSALDIFGGSTVKLSECIQWNQQHG